MTLRRHSPASIMQLEDLQLGLKLVVRSLKTLKEVEGTVVGLKGTYKGRMIDGKPIVSPHKAIKATIELDSNETIIIDRTNAGNYTLIKSV